MSLVFYLRVKKNNWIFVRKKHAQKNFFFFTSQRLNNKLVVIGEEKERATCSGALSRLEDHFSIGFEVERLHDVGRQYLV